jgi:hypothetical protein
MSDAYSSAIGLFTVGESPIGGLVPPTPAWVPPTGPKTIQNVIPSYLYVQYQDDDNLQSFVQAYNTYAQAYLDYLNGLNLPIYTGGNIAGGLLDWVALGIYGFERPVFATEGSQSVGLFNTYGFNVLEYNTLLPGVPSVYTEANDDIFKRVLTWHLYKGDGKVFNARWLKRRVARFLYGVDGTDPPVNPYAVSVDLTGASAATITVPNTPVSATFSQGVSQGVLELPFQVDWTVVVS